jgi:SOS-response transcriptional repressor LexA
MTEIKEEKSFKERLASLIGDSDVKPFARKCGVEEKSIRLYLAGKALPTFKSLLKIAEANVVSVAWLTGETDIKETPITTEAATYVADDVFRPTGRVPLISWVQAGDWTEVVDNYHPGDAEEWLAPTKKMGKNAFALHVSGDSMEPRFRDGDTIFVDPDIPPTSGKFVVAKINHSEATFKQLIHDADRTFLKPLNERYPVMDVTDRELRIVGVVTEKRELL